MQTPRQLTTSGRLKFSPVFCDRGRAIVYVEMTDPTLWRLQRLDLATGEIQPLHPEATTSEFDPCWTDDGRGYAYLKTLGGLSIGIVVRSVDGSVIGGLAPETGFFGYRSPVLSPDGSRLVFVHPERGTQQLHTSGLNGENRRALTNSVGLNNWPSFSPDGRMLTFGSSRDGNFEVYVMHADGTGARRVTDHPLQDIRPRFSPDGQRIAFTSHRDGNAEIYVVHADGTSLHRITDHPERDDYPAWHPDNRHLVTVSERNGRHDLYLWDVAG